jgi:hypothetical protein
MRPLRGIAFKLGSVVVFIVMSAMIKATSAHVPGGEAVFFRSLFAIPVIVAWLAWRGRTAHRAGDGRPTRPCLARDLPARSRWASALPALAYLPFPEVTAIGYAAPLLTVIFAAMFLNEKVGVFRISTVALGLTGVLIVIARGFPCIEGGADDAAALRGDAGSGRRRLCRAGAGLRAQAGAGRKDRDHRLLVLGHGDGAVAGTLPFGWVVPTPFETFAPGRCGIAGRGRADPPYLGLPRGRCLAGGAVRLCLDAVFAG